MFHPSLNLTEVFWKAEQSDDKIIYKGPGQYETIDRDKLQVFSLTYKNKPILEVRPAGRTLVWRMKTIGNLAISSGREVSKTRIHVVALLGQPGSRDMDQRCQVPFHPNYKPQVYFHDMEESTIYYLFENGKQETRTKFSTLSPYHALHLREEEFEHLMGVKDEMRPVDKQED